MLTMHEMRLIAPLWLGLLAGSAARTATAGDEAEFRPLFDGTSLTGWVQRGGAAKYSVEEEAIVGQSVPNTSNSFLCTEKEYGDFELELEFLVDRELNSGVQVRSQCFEDDRTVRVPGLDGEQTLTIPAGRVHGYQVEIDPSDRAYTGGIYDEGRRGWLFDLKDNEAARKAFKPGAWNSLRVVARGPSIRTWVNGVPAAELTDDLTPRGFIALQVHGVGDRAEPLHVRWRSIRIKSVE